MATVEKQGYFPHWTLKTEGIIAPDERLPWGQSIFIGLQHVLAMFGATVLAPIIMGFDPNTAIFFSGIGTILFFLIVGGRVPSYLGSSFSFIAVVIAASGYSGKGLNPMLDASLLPVAQDPTFMWEKRLSHSWLVLLLTNSEPRGQGLLSTFSAHMVLANKETPLFIPPGVQVAVFALERFFCYNYERMTDVCFHSPNMAGVRGFEEASLDHGAGERNDGAS